MLITNRRLGKACLHAIIMLSLPCIAASAAQETWSVSEGLSGSTKGVWTVTLNGDAISGWAEMFDSAGEPVTYFVSGKRVDDEFVMERQSPSNGVKCDYRLKGTPPESGEVFNGGSQCNGKDQLWMAQKIREPGQNGGGESSPQSASQ